jgi:hypothetical protein
MLSHWVPFRSLIPVGHESISMVSRVFLVSTAHFLVHACRTETARSEMVAASLKLLKVLLLGLWSSFPVVWVLADLSLLTPLSEQICWGICDYMAKVIPCASTASVTTPQNYNSATAILVHLGSHPTVHVSFYSSTLLLRLIAPCDSCPGASAAAPQAACMHRPLSCRCLFALLTGCV